MYAANRKSLLAILVSYPVIHESVLCFIFSLLDGATESRVVVSAVLKADQATSGPLLEFTLDQSVDMGSDLYLSTVQYLSGRILSSRCLKNLFLHSF